MSAINFPTSSVKHAALPGLSEPKKNSLHQTILDVKDQVATSSSWHQRIISHLNKWDTQLDEKIPNFFIQQKIDELGNRIEALFTPLKEFNLWLNSNGQGDWYLQLATFLIKLPMRAVRNIIQLIYNIIKEALYAAFHPLKAINRLAKLMISLTHELTKPETWSKMGSGIIGASIAQSLVTGNPISVLGVGIGAAMVIGGLSIGALKAAMAAEKDSRFSAIKENLQSQLIQLPESLLTGFGMGLIIGSIQRAIYNRQMHIQQFTSEQEARIFANQFIKDHQLPQYSTMKLDSSGKLIIQWNDHASLQYFQQKYPRLFEKSYSEIEFPTQLKVELHRGSSQIHLNFHGYDGFEGYDFVRKVPLEGDFSSWIYPRPAEDTTLSRYGALSGASAAAATPSSKA